MSNEVQLEHLQEILASQKATVFALLDACDEPRIPVLAKNLGEEIAVSLYRGLAAKNYANLAPYVIKLDATLLNWILDDLKDTPWGYFVITNDATSLADIRRHFRKFLIVSSPEGEDMYFRFYDPRVLPTFLLASDKNEITQFFGPVQDFVIGDQPPFNSITRKSV